jgi:ketosteroid isomerase-like protein
MEPPRRFALEGMLGAGALWALASCASVEHADPNALEPVLEADRAFARMALAEGAQKALVTYAAPDAIMFSPGSGPVRGRAAIGELFARVTAVPQWVPAGGAIASSGELAYTWGPYRWTPRDGGKPASGHYVSIWRRLDGQWRFVVDLGVDGPANLP